MPIAVASAVALSSRILGGHTEWAAALETWTTRELPGAPAAAKANLKSAPNWLADGPDRC